MYILIWEKQLSEQQQQRKVSRRSSLFYSSLQRRDKQSPCLFISICNRYNTDYINHLTSASVSLSVSLSHTHTRTHLHTHIHTHVFYFLWLIRLPLRTMWVGLDQAWLTAHWLSCYCTFTASVKLNDLFALCKGFSLFLKYAMQKTCLALLILKLLKCEPTLVGTIKWLSLI